MSVRTWRGRRVDANHAAIVEAFRAHGWSVQSLAAIGKGCPDLLVGKDRWSCAVEVKTAKGKLTADESKWFNAWRGSVVIVRSVDDVQRLDQALYISGKLGGVLRVRGAGDRSAVG